MSDYTLSATIEARDNASRVFNDISRSAEEFSRRVQNAGLGMQKAGKQMQAVGKGLTGAVTTPLLGVGGASAKMAVTFDSSLRKVATIADTTQVPIDQLKKSILKMSSETGVAASDIAESMYSAISAGQDTGKAIQFVGQATKLAKAGFTDSATAIDVLTTTMNAYGESAGSAEEVANKLIKTQNLGKTTVAELGATMGKAIPTANMFSVKLDDLAAAFVTTTKNGISTAESTTYINSMLNELGKAGTKVSDILKARTGKSFKELMKSGMSLTEVLSIVQEYCVETGEGIADVFGSQEAGKAAATLTQHAEDFNSALGEIQNSAGTLQTAFDTMNSSSAQELAVALNDLKNAGIQLGDAILPVVVPALEQLAGFIASCAEKFNALPPGVQEAIVKFGMFAAVAGPLLMIGGKIVTTIGQLATVFSGAAGGFGGLASAAGEAAGPVATGAGALGTLSQNALGLLAAGGGILLASTGIWMLADASAKIAEAGPGAAGALLLLVGALAAMAFGAAALAAPLTAGAVGLLAFGAGVLLVGGGIWVACDGIARLAEQFPTIAQYGLQAATAIGALGLGLATMGAGALVAGAGLVVLGAGLVAAGAGLVVFSAGLLALGLGVASLALGVGALDLALLGAVAELKSIASNSKAAAANLTQMVTSVDVVKSGLGALKTVAKDAVTKFVNAFKNGKPGAQAAATELITAMITTVQSGLLPLPVLVAGSVNQTTQAVKSGFGAMNAALTADMLTAVSTVRSAIGQMEAAFRGASFQLPRHIPLPHFSVSGKFNPETGAAPRVSVQWYAKAYDQAMLFSAPTVFGASGMGFGDGPGAEVVTGDAHLMDLMREVLAEQGGDIIIPVYVGQERVDSMVVTAAQRKNLRSGGR